jgi:hypothetical protein
VKERPILFSAPMVLAVFAGTKTQTRRAITPQPGSGVTPYATTLGTWNWVLPGSGVGTGDPFRCRYGVVGDRLWVRESLKLNGAESWCYAADNTEIALDENDPRVPAMVAWAHHKETGSCPSIHMPRWASRITLEITEVRVQRLHEITDEDAKAEGFPLPPGPGTVNGKPATIAIFNARMGFQALWRVLNDKRPGCSWDSNPFVLAVSFRRLSPKEAE